MNFGIFVPIVAIIAIGLRDHRAACTIANAAAQGRRAAPRRKRPNCCPARTRRCRPTIGRLEERLAVLERIATDPAERTAREIEELR